jgi:hypothetical protein
VPSAPDVRRRVEGSLGLAKDAAAGGVGLAKGAAATSVGLARDVAGTALSGFVQWRGADGGVADVVNDASAPAPTPTPAGEAAADTAQAAPSPSTSAPSPSTEAPAVDSLPIPDYDELSASQVVERLAGLDPQSLDAIRRYESAHRGRNTILGKIAQLS